MYFELANFVSAFLLSVIAIVCVKLLAPRRQTESCYRNTRIEK